MTPREKHISEDATRTSISLTAEDRAAIRWISEVRRASNDRRTTTNDILVDALWYLLEKTQGKTREQIQSMVPVIAGAVRSQSKITEMPKLKSKL